MKIAVALLGVVASTAALLSSSAPAPTPAQPPEPVPAAGIKIKYRVEGVSRIAKLGSELALGPGTLDAEIDLVTGDIVGQLELPPSDGYFVVFRFVPTTTRVEFLPANPVTGRVESGEIRAGARLHLRLDRVAVDGVPLDAGPDCRTAELVSVDLAGPFNLVQTTLKGVYAIPPYAGCVGAERLDPLFTGLISGPGNELELTLTQVL